MSNAFPVDGLAELNAILGQLPAKLATGAVRAGLTAGAAVVRDEARQLAHKKSGKMARAIRSGSPRKNQDGTYSIRVRLQGEHSFIGWFEEFGVAPHFIARTEGKQGRVAIRKAAEGAGKVTLRSMKIGEEFVSGIISHPGYEAHPFLRPALDNKREEAVQAYATRIRDYIEGRTGFAIPDGE